MQSIEPTLLTTSKNGPYAIFERIYNTVDRQKVSVGIHFYVDDQISEERWTFGSDNIDDLMNGGMGIELKFANQEISSALVHFREYKNDKILLYRILLFPNGVAEFLTGEDSEEIDSYHFATGEPLDLQPNHIYLDSDFLQASADVEFIPETIQVVSRDALDEMFSSINDLYDQLDEEFDEGTFNGDEDDLETCRKYNISSIDAYHLLAIEFENELYESDSFENPNNCLVDKKNQFVKLLSTRPYSNTENDEIIKNIENAMAIIDMLDIGHYPQIRFDLPMDDELELVITYSGGVTDIVISLTNQYVIYIDMPDGGESVVVEADFDEEELIDDIKQLIKKRLKK